jgi:hypothetical protein
MPSGSASDALRWLCTNYQDLQVLAETAGCGEQLADLLRQARDGADITGELRTLLRQADGPELTVRGIDLPGIAARSAGETYSCPGARCSIEVRREPGQPVPWCVVDNKDLVVKFS